MFALTVGVLLWFGFVHLAGWRACVSVISGTVPDGETRLKSAAVKGGIYLVNYFGVVVGAPILLLSSVILRVLRRMGCFS